MNKIFHIRMSKQMLKTVFYLSLSSICFLIVAIQAANASNGALGSEFFLLIGLLQLYNISLHIKIQMMLEVIDASTEMVEEVVDLTKRTLDTKSRELSDEQIKTICGKATEAVYKRMNDRVERVAKELSGTLFDPKEGPLKDVAKKIRAKLDGAVDEKAGPTTKISQWKYRD